MATSPSPVPQTDRPPAASPGSLDRANPEAEIARAARAYSNWGRWGADDVLGTVNFITDELRLAAAALVRRGASFSLSQRFDMDGPQRGWRRRTNPVHTMLDTGTDAALGHQGFPHGIGGADDVIAMPLQCSTQWDGLGHIFDHGQAWNGRDAAQDRHLRRRPGDRHRAAGPAGLRARRAARRGAGDRAVARHRWPAPVSGRAANCPTASRSPPST